MTVSLPSRSSAWFDGAPFVLHPHGLFEAEGTRQEGDRAAAS
jgi:hypothetical protein